MNFRIAVLPRGTGSISTLRISVFAYLEVLPPKKVSSGSGMFRFLYRTAMTLATSVIKSVYGISDVVTEKHPLASEEPDIPPETETCRFGTGKYLSSRILPVMMCAFAVTDMNRIKIIVFNIFIKDIRGFSFLLQVC